MVSKGLGLGLVETDLRARIKVMERLVAGLEQLFDLGAVTHLVAGRLGLGVYLTLEKGLG